MRTVQEYDTHLHMYVRKFKNKINSCAYNISCSYTLFTRYVCACVCVYVFA